MNIVKLFIISIIVNMLYAGEIKEKLFEAGKPYDLGYTLLAIAKVESNYGQVKININDPSCGITHIHLKYFLKKYNIKDTPFNRNLACQRLVDSDDLSISESIAILTYWKSRLCGRWGCTKSQWDRVWSAYNAGNNYESKAGKAYASKIRKIIKELK